MSHHHQHECTHACTHVIKEPAIGHHMHAKLKPHQSFLFNYPDVGIGGVQKEVAIYQHTD